MDSECDGSWLYVEHGARHYLVGAVDGDRHNGEVKLLGEPESAVLEGVNLSIVGATSFGENDNRHSLCESLLGVVHGLDDASCRVVVDHDMSCHVARPAHEREVVQALAHHPLEIVAQVAVDGENVVGTLMVGNEDVGAVVVDEIAVLYLDAHAKEEAHGPCPPLGWEVAPIVAVEEAANDGDYAGDNGENQHDRCRNAVVIYAIQNVHANVIDSFVGAKIVKSCQLSIISSQFFPFWPKKKFTSRTIVNS